QSSAAAKPLLFAVSVIALLGAGCGALDAGSSEATGLQSEVLAFDEATAGAEGTSDAEAGGTGSEVSPTDSSTATDADADAGQPDEPAPLPGEVEPAAGSSDTDPALSPDPNVVYAAGTCYSRTIPGQQAELIDCGEPHQIEVYASVDLPGGPETPYQGLDAAFEICGAEFRQITGVGLNLATVFERSVLRPSEETWADGERNVTCYVVFPEATIARLAEISPVRSFGRVSVFGLEAGDCLLDFDQSASWFEVVGCDEPHEAEVFIADQQADGAFPGDEAMDARADELCFGPPFNEFVGRDYASSSIFSFVSVPTAETWDQGDRTINCILTDELVRSASFQDSGL
ncbi:MAG: septum formation family protein, partial [Actinomycetota bacterium]